MSCIALVQEVEISCVEQASSRNECNGGGGGGGGPGVLWVTSSSMIVKSNGV